MYITTAFCLAFVLFHSGIIDLFLTLLLVLKGTVLKGSPLLYSPSSFLTEGTQATCLLPHCDQHLPSVITQKAFYFKGFGWPWPLKLNIGYKLRMLQPREKNCHQRHIPFANYLGIVLTPFGPLCYLHHTFTANTIGPLLSSASWALQKLHSYSYR